MKPPALFAFLLLVPAFAAPPAPDNPPGDPITQLPPFKVHDDPINSFGFDLAVYWDRATRKVTRVFIGKIHENSAAAALDVQPGDEIRRINGRPVTEFDAGIGAGTELGEVFLDRRPGAKLDLDIIRHRPGRITVVAGPVREF